MNKLHVFTVTIGLLALASCGTTKGAVTEVQETTINYPNDEVANGAGLYNTKCSRCHKAKTITNYTSAQWDNILPRMAQKAKIDASTEATIKSYITWTLEQ